MLGRQTTLRKPIPTMTVIVAVILLVGVLSMGYGYYQNSHAMLYAGLTMTIIGVLNGIVLLVTRPNAFGSTRQRR